MSPKEFMDKYKDKIDNETFVEMSTDVEKIATPAEVDNTELDAAKAEAEAAKAEAEEYKAKYEDSLAKYKERFLSADPVEAAEEIIDEPKVEEEIDVKEI